MAYRRTQTETKQATTEKESNKYYLNLGVTLADGTFVRLSVDNSIVISLDKFMSQAKNINKDSEWAKHQLIRNAAIAELQTVFEGMQDGTSLHVDETNTKVLPRITFQLSKAGVKGEISDESLPSQELLAELLG